MSTSSKGGRLAWYMRRLASMSPPEVAHRFIERGKQFADSRTNWNWDRFKFDGAIAPLPGLRVEDCTKHLTEAVERDARATLNGDISFLSAQWPKPGESKWWRSDVWSLDPASGKHWPGRGQRASKSAYRHAEDFGDVKFVWEINRLQFLMPLAVAAHRDQDRVLAAEIADVLDGWMEFNPPYDGVNWTNGIEFATRVIVGLFVNTLIADIAPPSFAPRLRQFLAAHVWMLARYPSLFSSANNHRIAELAALYIAYTCASTLRGASRRAHEAHELESEVLKQFHADGVGAEQSPTYAAYSLEWFALAAMCGEANGDARSSAYKTRLRDAARHLRWMMDDAGRTPAICDDDEGRVVALGPKHDYLYPGAICATVSRWLGDGESAPPPQAPTLFDAFTSAPAPASLAPKGRRTFADGGYSVWRIPTTHGDAMFAIDHGPLGFLSIAAHGHADALAVWLHVGDEPVIIDAGTYLYHTRNHARDRFRSTLAHNTLCLDGQNQSRIAGPFNWSQHAKTKLRSPAPNFSAEHDGYVASHGVKHVRSVQVDGARITIRDSLEGALPAPKPWSTGYTFHQDTKIEMFDDHALVTTPKGARLRISVQLANAGKAELNTVEVSPGFGKLASAQRLVARGEAANAGAVLTTMIEVL
ncbi:heparinase II/III family protein [Vitreimonas flagellata]|uniref:heparinase II/III family protein n=1 Tax=Vitreimonas flagellata TaxID=2560861 RepID=UPI0010753145|nr:alginate lyase family protein [Vitreimonas flagellata]